MTVTAIDTPPDVTAPDPLMLQLRDRVWSIDDQIAVLRVKRSTLRHAIEQLDDFGLFLADMDVARPPFYRQLVVQPEPPAKVGVNIVMTESTPAEVAAKVAAAVMPTESPKPSAKREPKHRDRSDRNTGNRPGPRSDKPDYPTIAVEIRRLLDAGERVKPGLAATFGVPATSVKNWMTRCRQLGLLDGAAPAVRGRPSAKPARVEPKAEATVTPIGSAKSAAKPTRNWTEIAGHITAFRDQGVSVEPALAKLYGVHQSTAKQWVRHCRETGLVAPLEAGLKVLEDNTVPDNPDAVYVAEKVAAEYLDAVRNNRRPIASVADLFDIDKPTAVDWVRRARADGALPPANEPQLSEAERRALLDMAKPEPVA